MTLESLYDTHALGVAHHLAQVAHIQLYSAVTALTGQLYDTRFAMAKLSFRLAKGFLVYGERPCRMLTGIVPVCRHLNPNSQGLDMIQIR